MANYPFNNESSQSERKEVLKNDRPSTFKDFTFANETRGGRYAKSDSGPTVRPLPPSSPWASNPVPAEPPLGYDINAVPDLGFPLNKQSVAQAPADPSPSAVETASDERDAEATPVPSLSEK